MLIFDILLKIFAKKFGSLKNVRTFAIPKREKRGNSSVGRAQPCQGWGREFEPRFPLSLKFWIFSLQNEALRINAEIAQLVEHNLAKVGVASSSLVFRSK